MYSGQEVCFRGVSNRQVAHSEQRMELRVPARHIPGARQPQPQTPASVSPTIQQGKAQRVSLHRKSQLLMAMGCEGAHLGRSRIRSDRWHNTRLNEHGVALSALVSPRICVRFLHCHLLGVSKLPRALHGHSAKMVWRMAHTRSLCTCIPLPHWDSEGSVNLFQRCSRQNPFLV